MFPFSLFLTRRQHSLPVSLPLASNVPLNLCLLRGLCCLFAAFFVILFCFILFFSDFSHFMSQAPVPPFSSPAKSNMQVSGVWEDVWKQL